MTTDSSLPVTQPALQFDQAEPLSEIPSELTCHYCQKPLLTEYWALNNQPSCEGCQQAVVTHITSPIAWGTWGKILLHGGGAALLGTLIYFAVLKLTGYEFGLVSIGVGLLVGTVVRKAAGLRGGWKLQAAAMALTYASIVSAYMPTVYEGLISEMNKPGAANTKEHTSTAVAAQGAQGTAAKTVASQPVEPTAQSASNAGERTPESLPLALLKLIGGSLLVLSVTFGVAAAAPILAGPSNILGWIIIAVALYEAWKLTRKVKLALEGPFPVPVGSPVVPAVAAAGTAT